MLVTLYTRVWIEISSDNGIFSSLSVTLYTRVWIEIRYLPRASIQIISHPLHEGVD